MTFHVCRWAFQQVNMYNSAKRIALCIVFYQRTYGIFTSLHNSIQILKALNVSSANSLLSLNTWDLVSNKHLNACYRNRYVQITILLWKIVSIAFTRINLIFLDTVPLTLNVEIAYGS